MPKKSKAKRRIPPWGRSGAAHMPDSSHGANDYAADVPLGNTDPTVRFGVMLGGMPNASRMARGSTRAYRGKYT